MLSFDRDSVFLYEFYTIVEAASFIGFLFLQIVNKTIRKAVFITGLVFIAFTLLYPYFSRTVNVIDSIPIGIETIIILVYSFYFLYEKTNDTKTLYIYSTFPFWIVIGMVLYLAGSFFIYIFADSLSPQEVYKYWIVTNILSIMKNIFFAIGIIVNSRPPKKLPFSEYELSSLN